MQTHISHERTINLCHRRNACHSNTLEICHAKIKHAIILGQRCISLLLSIQISSRRHFLPYFGYHINSDVSIFLAASNVTHCHPFYFCLCCIRCVCITINFSLYTNQFKRAMMSLRDENNNNPASFNFNFSFRELAALPVNNSYLPTPKPPHPP